MALVPQVENTIYERLVGLIETFFNSYGVQIELIDNADYTEQDELVNDMMMLASFSGRLYSRRASQCALKTDWQRRLPTKAPQEG